MSRRITTTVRDLRRNATPAETAFWELVRNKHLDGHRFYRQYPIAFELDGTTRHFIADFYCRQMKLVVEIDGDVHEHQQEYDRYRTMIIECLGMRVVRFSNAAIMSHAKEVMQKLRECLAEYPSPCIPLPKGRGTFSVPARSPSPYRRGGQGVMASHPFIP